MVKPNWNIALSDVLKHPTQQITKISNKTGKEYQTEAISELNVILVGTPEEVLKDNIVSTIYPIHDPKAKLEYQIKVLGKNKNLVFGSHVLLKNVVGGSTNSGGWYQADSIEDTNKNV